MTNTPDDFLALLLNPRDYPPAPVQIGARSGALYYRCAHCCAVFTTRAQIPTEEKAVCACGGTGVDFLGKSTGAHLTRTEQRSACDARCTNAMGPNCDCLCGGANHGTGKIVDVEIISGIPRIRMNDPEAPRRRAEFETECEAAKARVAGRYGLAVQDVTRAKWIPNRQIWRAVVDTLEGIAQARAMKVHRNRIATLQNL